MRSNLLILVSFLTACGVEAPVSPITIDRLELSAPGDTFLVQTSLQLSAQATWSDGQQRDVTQQVTWQSNDESTLAITSLGRLNLRACGKAIIRATLEGVTVERTFTSRPAKLERLTLSPADVGLLPLGHSVDFRVTGWFEDGTQHDVTADATWNGTASPTFVATQQGLMTVGVQLGELSAQTSFTVTPPLIEGLEVTTEGSMLLTDTKQLSALVHFSNGETRDVTGDSEWASSDPTIISVADTQTRGVLAAHAPGTVLITTTWNGRVATTLIHVSAP